MEHVPITSGPIYFYDFIASSLLQGLGSLRRPKLGWADLLRRWTRLFCCGLVKPVHDKPGQVVWVSVNSWCIHVEVLDDKLVSELEI